jgi:hypothetical protein
MLYFELVGANSDWAQLFEDLLATAQPNDVDAVPQPTTADTPDRLGRIALARTLLIDVVASAKM